MSDRTSECDCKFCAHNSEQFCDCRTCQWIRKNWSEESLLQGMHAPQAALRRQRREDSDHAAPASWTRLGLTQAQWENSDHE